MDKRRRRYWPGLLRLLAVGLGLSVLWPRLRGAPWLPMRMRAVHKLLALVTVLGLRDRVQVVGGTCSART